jgi:hypothetical protein
MPAWQIRCSVTSPSVLGKGKACSSGMAPRRNLSKQSLQGQVSVKLTPEICINNTASNSRLTAVGRWATATDTIHRAVSRLFFCLPSFNETTTELHLHAEKLTETVLHLNLGHFVVFFVFFSFGFFPLWWDNDRTTSESPSPGLQAEGLTPKLLRLKLYCIWTWRLFNFLIFIYFYFFIIFFLNPLSNACSAYCWLVHYLSLFISLKFFLFVCIGFFLFVHLYFPLSLTSLLSLSSHPSILNITIVIITS